MESTPLISGSDTFLFILWNMHTGNMIKLGDLNNKQVCSFFGNNSFQISSGSWPHPRLLLYLKSWFWSRKRSWSRWFLIGIFFITNIPDFLSSEYTKRGEARRGEARRSESKQQNLASFRALWWISYSRRIKWWKWKMCVALSKSKQNIYMIECSLAQ